jgi:hypothetical protein
MIWRIREALSDWVDRIFFGWREPFNSEEFTISKLRHLSAEGIEHILKSERISRMQGGGFNYVGEAVLRELELRNAMRQGLASWVAVAIALLALCVSLAQCARGAPP